MEAPTVILSANSCWNVVNFRGGLIRALGDRGFRIVVAAPADEHRSKVAELGAEFIEVAMNSAGSSVIEHLLLFARYLKVMREFRPFAYLGFTAKPNIYGSVAARLVGARVINNISGLGTVFIKQGLLTVVVKQLYRFSLRGSSTIFFQNRDDLELFVASGLAPRARSELLPGSGIDLERFAPSGEARNGGPFRFMLPARLLWDKGVAEYVEAARIVRRSHPDVRFQLLGPAGANNRTAVPPAMLERWRAEQAVEYLGHTDDVRPAIEQADCIVLPSYREGLPRALLEGSAMGKPLIATDVPGCRDVVVESETGYLCAERSADSLAQAMLKMLRTSPSERLAMGQRGRRRVEREFCQSRVIAKYLDALGT